MHSPWLVVVVAAPGGLPGLPPELLLPLPEVLPIQLRLQHGQLALLVVAAGVRVRLLRLLLVLAAASSSSDGLARAHSHSSSVG